SSNRSPLLDRPLVRAVRRGAKMNPSASASRGPPIRGLYVCLYVAFYEAAGRVKSASCPPRYFVFSAVAVSDRLLVSRGSSAFYSRSSEARDGARRRRRGFEGGGAIYAATLGPRSRRHSRSPTLSNPRETRGRTACRTMAQTGSVAAPTGGEGWRGVKTVPSRSSAHK